MAQHRRTELGPRGLILRGGGAPEEVPFFAGAMHYWRVQPRSWRACLERMRGAGLRLVQSYVPWSVHEDKPGVIAWDGELDLGRFLDRVGDLGMLAVLRPGPHVNAELTGFGFPDRILRSRAIQARTARGTPAWLPVPPRAFPVPSYASTAFRAEVGGWLGEAAEVIAPRLWPNGPVVALQVDNEQHMMFRSGAFDLDYHPDALDWWHDYAGDLEPPRAWDPDDPGRCARWVAFKEHYAARALGWVAEELDAAGLGAVARYHNLPPCEPSHVDLPAIEQAINGPCGMDFYHTAADYPVVRRRALHLCGTASPLPVAPEVGVGGPPWLTPMSEADQESVMLGLLAAGVRGMGLYMMVDRERWYGAAIGPDGSIDAPSYDRIRRIVRALDAVDWPSLRREAVVAIFLARADARFASASSVADPVSPLVAEFLRPGPAGAAELGLDEAAARHRRWIDAVERALALAQIPYDIVDEGVPASRLGDYKAVVAPTLDRVDRAAWARLRQAAEAGTRIILGPGRPSRDEFDQPLGEDGRLPPKVGLIRPESLEDLDGLADDLAAVAGDLEDLWIPADGDAVDTSVYRDRNGSVRVLFVGNRTGNACSPRILVPFGARLEDVTGGDRLAEAAGQVELSLAPWQVRMFRISPSSARRD